MVDEIPVEVRELVRDELGWLADFIHKNYGYDYGKINRIIRLMLTVSV